MNANRLFPATMKLTLFLASFVFFFLSGLFILVPVAGAHVYGLDAHTASALFYIRAIGLRDLALAAYIMGLTVLGQRSALAILLALTTVIPAGDLLLLALTGTGAVLNYSLHAISLIAFAFLALWVRP